MFNSKSYWENRYKSGGNSGVGSYGVLCQFKADIINGLIERYNLKTGLEMGCGDGNQLKEFNFKTYTGLDVSETTIMNCKSLYNSDKTKDFYMYNDITTLKDKRFDCTLSLDVIYHLIENIVFEDYIDNLFNFSDNIVIIYSFGSNAEGLELPTHVVYRPMDIITQKFPQWELIENIKNKHPDISYAEFYIYKKN
jgi:SAM-dependent methyltransferase